MIRRLLVVLGVFIILALLAVLFAPSQLDAEFAEVRAALDAGTVTEAEVRKIYGDEAFYRMFPEKRPANLLEPNATPHPPAPPVARSKYETP